MSDSTTTTTTASTSDNNNNVEEDAGTETSSDDDTIEYEIEVVTSSPTSSSSASSLSNISSSSSTTASDQPEVNKSPQESSSLVVDNKSINSDCSNALVCESSNGETTQHSKDRIEPTFSSLSNKDDDTAAPLAGEISTNVGNSSSEFKTTQDQPRDDASERKSYVSEEQPLIVEQDRLQTHQSSGRVDESPAFIDESSAAKEGKTGESQLGNINDAIKVAGDATNQVSDNKEQISSATSALVDSQASNLESTVEQVDLDDGKDLSPSSQLEETRATQTMAPQSAPDSLELSSNLIDDNSNVNLAEEKLGTSRINPLEKAGGSEEDNSVAISADKSNQDNEQFKINNEVSKHDLIEQSNNNNNNNMQQIGLTNDSGSHIQKEEKEEEEKESNQSNNTSPVQATCSAEQPTLSKTLREQLEYPNGLRRESSELVTRLSACEINVNVEKVEESNDISNESNGQTLSMTEDEPQRPLVSMVDISVEPPAQPVEDKARLSLSMPPNNVFRRDSACEDLEREFDEEPEFEPRQVKLRRNQDARSEYELADELGRGRYGTVYLCRENSTGRSLAAKFINVRRSEDREDVEREVGIMSKLQHKRLLQLYDAFDNEAKSEMCLITELIEGGELFERIVNDDFDLTEKKAAIFMRQICEGVEYMHSQQIVHLDMKPENILCLSKTGNRIKLIDFGLARELHPSQPLHVMFGTPDFAAPEVLAYEAVTFATDMWSIGVICYVLLSGLLPFMGDNDMETMANVTKAEFDFDDQAFEPITDLAKDFISKLLVRDPSKRLKPRECLQHAWLQKGGAQLEAAVIERRKSSIASLSFLLNGAQQARLEQLALMALSGSNQQLGSPDNSQLPTGPRGSISLPVQQHTGTSSMQTTDSGSTCSIPNSDAILPALFSLNKRNLKRYVIRRKWHKTVHAIMALGRMGATLRSKLGN